MQRLYDALYRLTRISTWIAGAGYLLVALATTGDVIARNLWSISSPEVYEISGYIFAVATTWGFAFVLFERAHVRIDVVYQSFSTAVRAWLDLVALVSMGLFASVLSYRSWLTLDETLLFASRARTSLQTPLWIPQSIWLAGLVYFTFCIAFIALYVLVLLLKRDYARVGQIAGVPHVAAHEAPELVPQSEGGLRP